MRRYESDPTVIHPDVHHRINHLMQEIQYLRAIIDRLQQENAELRRADPTYSSHSSASTSSHPSYTLHPLYSSSSVQRSPQTYGSNALALAEMYQGPYPQNYHARTQAEPEVSPAGYPSEAPAPHGQQQHHHHHSATSDSRQSGLYQSNPSMDWPTMRQPGHLDDRPRTAPIDHHGGQTLQNDHESSGPGPNYIYQGHTQGNFYPPEPRQAGSRPDGSAPHSSSHSTSPSGPSSAGGSAHIYAQYSNQALSASVPGNRPPQSGLGTSEHSQGWHNPTPPNMGYGPAGLHLPPGALPVAEERQDYNYQSVHFPQHLPHDSRSNTHSPSGAGRGDSRGGPS